MIAIGGAVCERLTRLKCICKPNSRLLFSPQRVILADNSRACQMHNCVTNDLSKRHDRVFFKAIVGWVELLQRIEF